MGVHSIGVAQRTKERVTQMLKELKAQVICSLAECDTHIVNRAMRRCPSHSRSLPLNPPWSGQVESRKTLRAKLMRDVEALWELLQVWIPGG